MADNEPGHLRDLTAEVAAAYFSNSHVNPADIGQVIKQIADSLAAIGETAPATTESEPEQAAAAAAPAPAPAAAKLTSAQIRKSITADALISFEDGRPYKTLRRHLTVRGMTPDEYRQKWGLPRDYPMTSPNYSAARSEMARSIGLGRKVAATPGNGRRRKPSA